MKNRYYLLDFYPDRPHAGPVSNRDAAAMRCGRFTSRDAALRTLRTAVGTRFALLDRQTGELITKDDLS